MLIDKIGVNACPVAMVLEILTLTSQERRASQPRVMNKKVLSRAEEADDLLVHFDKFISHASN